MCSRATDGRHSVATARLCRAEAQVLAPPSFGNKGTTYGRYTVRHTVTHPRSQVGRFRVGGARAGTETQQRRASASTSPQFPEAHPTQTPGPTHPSPHRDVSIPPCDSATKEEKKGSARFFVDLSFPNCAPCIRSSPRGRPRPPATLRYERYPHDIGRHSRPRIQWLRPRYQSAYLPAQRLLVAR